MDYEIRQRLNRLAEQQKHIAEIYNEEEINRELAELEKQMAVADFWENPMQAKTVTQRFDRLRNIRQDHSSVSKELAGMQELGESMTDEEDFADFSILMSDVEKKVDNWMRQKLMGDPFDTNNAIVTIHPGAGGTESCDWAEMLLRMYLRWAALMGFSVKVWDQQPGDEAGIKNATILISGAYAYGNLKSEKGVHRLVRISPFDANARRHTSFASVYIMPEVDDTIELDFDEKDLRIDTYRASGAGGQHVNKTDSAVRITHLPTGIVVQCQNERSQHKNKGTAMKIMRARLFARQEQEREEAMAKLGGAKQDIAWGSQIRSYVFCPYTMVKDHRTNIEVGDVQKVMDGVLDAFITGYLRWRAVRVKN